MNILQHRSLYGLEMRNIFKNAKQKTDTVIPIPDVCEASHYEIDILTL
jgi:hypothetical protein